MQVAPDYNYIANIRAPEDIGVTTDGTFDAIGKDIEAIVAYVQLMISGNTPASKTGSPLGNKFFLSTSQQCTGPNGELTTRYLYIDNIPDGSLPFVPAGMAVNLPDFKGLLPGIISQLSKIDPTQIFTAFSAPDKLDCQPVTLKTVDIYNRVGSDTQYVATKDLEKISPCDFVNTGVNPVTNLPCKESFDMKYNRIKMPNDNILRLFIYSLGILGLYIFISLLRKNGRKMMKIDN